MRVILCTDFGSTFTKLTAIDTATGEIIATARAFTTIDSNVMLGFETALTEIHAMCGVRDFEVRLAASSAAGGLKMVSCGLVPDLTAKASRLAAASAGAKVVKTFSYELTSADVMEIEEICPDIILLSGGIDGGNKDVLLRNANALAQISGGFCVIVAGNRTAVDVAQETLANAGKRVVTCENVMPQFGKLNIDPAKNAIRDIFIQNIISAKGLDAAQQFMSAEVIPTPLAVFNAARLFAEGLNDESGFEEGLGELMVFDLGGATTDVYSMASGLPNNKQVYVQGLIEPFAKRTVEGDIGMRYSLGAMLDVVEEKDADILTWQAICQSNPAVLAVGEYKHFSPVEQFLATEAIRLSAARHVGFYETAYTPMGDTTIQTGKDLTQVKYVIGTGGAIIGAEDPLAILQAATYLPGDGSLLKPLSPKLLLDIDYCLSAVGLLAQQFPRLALEMMKRRFA